MAETDTPSPSIRIEWPQPEHARLVLDRPARHNALGLEELLGVMRATETLKDRRPRVVSLVGLGASFSVGGDIQAFSQALSRGEMAAWLREAGRALNTAIARLNELDAAIVVGVQGAAAGGALGLMWAGDMIVAADDLKLNLAYARLGGSPDGATTWFLPRLLAHPQAFELLALCRTLDARQAQDLQLVNRVVPANQLRQQVDDLAQELLRVPPESLRNIKRLLRKSPSASIETQMHDEIESFVRAAAHPAFGERVSAFLRKAPAPAADA